MKFRLRTILLLMSVLLYSAVLPDDAVAQGDPPNIILIMADDLGYETLGANGGDSYSTPHLDRLAANGARFEHCYALPICTPSRVQLMTGKYNVRNYRKFGVLDRSERTFAHLLKEKGYATCIAGKWQLGSEPDSPQHFGFDEALLWQHTRGARREGSRLDTRYENPRLERNGVEVDYDNGEYGPDLMADFICEFIGKNKQKPFLAYYSMILTHCPFVPTPLSDDWDSESKGSETYKGQAKYFGDMVHYMDRLVGRIEEELKRNKLEEKTIILFTGDNGTDTPVVSRLNGKDVAGAKGKTTDAGTHVPLIAHWPGTVRSSVITDLVDLSDFLPTLCDLAGVEIPSDDTLDGRSFLPQILGKKGNPREYIYSWYSRSGDHKEARVFARTHRYKYYRSGEFYDLEQDNLEKVPLDDASLTAGQKQVREMLRNVIARYNDIRTET
jgi:arylsulfatase A